MHSLFLETMTFDFPSQDRQTARAPIHLVRVERHSESSVGCTVGKVTVVVVHNTDREDHCMK